MQVRSLGLEDPLEEGMAIHSSIPAWRIPWTEESGRLQPIGSQRFGHDGSYLAHSFKISGRFYYSLLEAVKNFVIHYTVLDEGNIYYSLSHVLPYFLSESF